jgi:hypothetical protein
MEITAKMGGPHRPAKNEFEKVESVQPDALTLELIARDGAQFGIVHCPAAATGGRLPKDYRSEPMPGKEAIKSAVKLANDMKAPIVVLDPQELWPAEWGTLYIAVDDDSAG